MTQKPSVEYFSKHTSNPLPKEMQAGWWPSRVRVQKGTGEKHIYLFASIVTSLRRLQCFMRLNIKSILREVHNPSFWRTVNGLCYLWFLGSITNRSCNTSSEEGSRSFRSNKILTSSSAKTSTIPACTSSWKQNTSGAFIIEDTTNRWALQHNPACKIY